MEKIRFENLSKSPMELSAPEWQNKIMERVSEEYSAQAVECSEAKQATIAEGCFAVAFESVLRTIPRYCWIKNIDGWAGEKYDATIDLALHTVLFEKIE